MSERAQSCESEREDWQWNGGSRRNEDDEWQQSRDRSRDRNCNYNRDMSAYEGSGGDRERDEYYRNGGDFRGSGGGRHGGSYHQSGGDARIDGGTYQDRHSDPRGGGGIDLQQYTRNDNWTDQQGWETVPSRNQRQSRGDTSWHHQQQQHQPRGPPPPPFMLILVGIPGSGKSTFANSLESAAPQQYVRINQDTLGNRRKCEEVTRQTLANNKCPIIDRCNFNPSQRRYFLDIAREFNIPVYCVSLELPVEECVRRCESRTNHETIQPGDERQVVDKMRSMFEAPHVGEGFRNVQRVSHVNQVNELMAEYSR